MTKKSLHTILFQNNLEVASKSTPTHSESLIEYFITDLSSTVQSKKVLTSKPPINKDQLVTFLITELKN